MKSGPEIGGDGRIVEIIPPMTCEGIAFLVKTLSPAIDGNLSLLPGCDQPNLLVLVVYFPSSWSTVYVGARCDFGGVSPSTRLPCLMLNMSSMLYDFFFKVPRL